MSHSHSMKSDLEKEFRALIKSANNLVNMAGRLVDETASSMRTVSGGVRSMSEMAGEGSHVLRERYHDLEDRIGSGVKQANSLVRDHPYLTMGTVLAAGVAIAFAFYNRSR